MMNRNSLSLAMLFVLAGALPAASMTIVEPGVLQLQKTWSISGTGSVTYNPFDGFAYVGQRTGGRVFRLENDETKTQIGVSAGSDVAGMAADPVTGDVYATNDFEGGISRFDASNGWARTQVISSLISGEDDTAGIFILPTTYTGNLAGAGDGLVTDRNNAGDDFLFSFLNPTNPGDAHAATQLARSNTQPAVNPPGVPTPNGGASTWVDVTASDSTVYLLDDGQETSNDVGQIYRVSDAGELLPILDDASPLNWPRGVATPLAGGVLYVTERDTAGVYAVDPITGDQTLLVSGLATPQWGSIAINPDGTLLWVAEDDAVYQFAIVPEPGTAALLALGAGLAARRRR